MFDSKTRLSARLADATDLLIDFATLGEYGLEPTGHATPACETRIRPTTPPTASPCPQGLSYDRPFVLRP
jgi:hypothetical protein